MLEKCLGSPCLEFPSEICDHGFNIKPGREKICISAVLPSSLGSGMGLGQVWDKLCFGARDGGEAWEKA